METQVGDPLALANRPLVDGRDLTPTAERNEIVSLVSRYAEAGLPVLNGTVRYSNIAAGADLAHVCSPYRLWEYGSLLEHRRLAAAPGTFLDVGGAGSALPFALAERGWVGTAIDLQDLPVAICESVARRLRLPLTAQVQDAASLSAARQFDLVTSISVLEHVPPVERPRFLSGLRRALKDSGLCYLTFDYGRFSGRTTSYAGPASATVTTAISDLGELCEQLVACGFAFDGNDPRDLPEAILRTVTPGWRDVRRRQLLSIGPVDARTPWRTLIGYALRRCGVHRQLQPRRYAEHSYFRMFLVAA
jgi:hypothetical protein